MMIRKDIILYVLLINVAILLVTSCLKSALTYEGRQVKEENRIVINEGGPHESVWETKNLILNYTYIRKGNNLELSGVVKFSNYLSVGFRYFIDFIMRAHFTNAEGVIIGTQTIAVASIGQEVDNISFKKKIKLPQDAVTMVFSYRGSVSQGRDREDGWLRVVGSDWYFWNSPTR